MHVTFPNFQLLKQFINSRDNLYHNYSPQGRPDTICFPAITNNGADEQTVWREHRHLYSEIVCSNKLLKIM